MRSTQVSVTQPVHPDSFQYKSGVWTDQFLLHNDHPAPSSDQGVSSCEASVVPKVTSTLDDWRHSLHSRDPENIPIEVATRLVTSCSASSERMDSHSKVIHFLASQATDDNQLHAVSYRPSRVILDHVSVPLSPRTLSEVVLPNPAWNPSPCRVHWNHLGNASGFDADQFSPSPLSCMQNGPVLRHVPSATSSHSSTLHTEITVHPITSPGKISQTPRASTALSSLKPTSPAVAWLVNQESLKAPLPGFRISAFGSPSPSQFLAPVEHMSIKPSMEHMSIKPSMGLLGQASGVNFLSVNTHISGDDCRHHTLAAATMTTTTTTTTTSTSPAHSPIDSRSTGTPKAERKPLKELIRLHEAHIAKVNQAPMRDIRHGLSPGKGPDSPSPDSTGLLIDLPPSSMEHAKRTEHSHSVRAKRHTVDYSFTPTSTTTVADSHPHADMAQRTANDLTGPYCTRRALDSSQRSFDTDSSSYTLVENVIESRSVLTRNAGTQTCCSTDPDHPERSLAAGLERALVQKCTVISELEAERNIIAAKLEEQRKVANAYQKLEDRYRRKVHELQVLLQNYLPYLDSSAAKKSPVDPTMKHDAFSVDAMVPVDPMVSGISLRREVVDCADGTTATGALPDRPVPPHVVPTSKDSVVSSSSDITGLGWDDSFDPVNLPLFDRYNATSV